LVGPSSPHAARLATIAIHSTRDEPRTRAE
jgi:hypothetical protein